MHAFLETETEKTKAKVEWLKREKELAMLSHDNSKQHSKCMSAIALP